MFETDISKVIFYIFICFLFFYLSNLVRNLSDLCHSQSLQTIDPMYECIDDKRRDTLDITTLTYKELRKLFYAYHMHKHKNIKKMYGEYYFGVLLSK